MKKLLCLIFIIFCIFAISGCGIEYNNILNTMSDLRINYFIGKAENFEVTLSCGYREEIFAYDGVSTNPIECGVISLAFYETHSYLSLEILLEVDGEEQSYILEKSPFEDVFMVDIEKILTNQNTIYFKLKNQNTKTELKEISNSWNVDYKLAIKLASEHFKETINKLYFNNKFNAECYLKPIYKSDFGNIYWYFSIIDTTGGNHNILIDVKTKEIITTNHT